MEDPPDKDVGEEIVNNSLLLRNLAVPSQFGEEEQWITEEFQFQQRTRKLSKFKVDSLDLMTWVGLTQLITVPQGFALLLVLWISPLVLWMDRYPVSPLRPPVACSRVILVLSRPSVTPQTVLADEDRMNLRTKTFFTVHRVLILRVVNPVDLDS